jgi:hypothetical protein
MGGKHVLPSGSGQGRGTDLFRARLFRQLAGRVQHDGPWAILLVCVTALAAVPAGALGPGDIKDWLTLAAGQPLLVACFVAMMRQLAKQHREAMLYFRAMEARLTALSNRAARRWDDPPRPAAQDTTESETP